MKPAVQEGKIDARSFWTALGQRPLGATVVTARASGGPAGFLGLSATHVSGNPPEMLVSIDKRTAALSTILSTAHFAVNYLASGDEDVAKVFSGRTETTGAGRFAHGAWSTLGTGAPILLSAVGAIDCRLVEVIDRQQVAVVIGRVVDTMIQDQVSPLVYFRGGYTRLA